MKKLILITILLISTKCFCQIEYENNYVKIDTSLWGKLKIAYLESEIDNDTKDSVITNLLLMDSINQIRLNNKDSVYNAYKQAFYDCKQLQGTSINKPAESTLFQFTGFWIGGATFYMFDSEFDKSTLINKLYNNLSLTLHTSLIINGKYELRPVLDIPLNKDTKTKINLNFGYKIEL